MLSKLVNFIVFQGAWFACILGGAKGVPWLGVAVVVASATGHLIHARFDRGLAALFAAAFALGWALDWAVMASGAMAYPEQARLLTPVPLWMPCMWLSFATTLTLSLGWLRGRFMLGVLFGLIGGPAAYYTGMKLGAVELTGPLSRALLIIAVEWAIAMPLLLLLATPRQAARTARPEAPAT